MSFFSCKTRSLCLRCLVLADLRGIQICSITVLKPLHVLRIRDNKGHTKLVETLRVRPILVRGDKGQEGLPKKYALNIYCVFEKHVWALSKLFAEQTCKLLWSF